MSATREGFLMFVLVSAVISALMVGSALAFFLPEKTPEAPRGDGSAEEIAALRREVDQLRDALALAGEARKSLEVELDGFLGRVEELENAPAVAAAPAPKALFDFGTKEDQMAAGLKAMMKIGMSRAKDRFIKEIMDPTEATDARAKRQRDRIVERIADMLSLDEVETAEMDRILTEVDTSRRQQFKTLFAGKADPKTDTEFSEIKKILDDSFKVEDDMIKQSLPAEKVKEFEKNAAPFRMFIYSAAQMAFPDKKE